MLASLQGVENNVLVFVGGGSHEHRDDIRIVEYLPVIRNAGCLRMGPLGTAQHQGEIVADGCQLQFLDVFHSSGNFPAPFAKSDNGAGKGVSVEVRFQSRGHG